MRMRANVVSQLIQRWPLLRLIGLPSAALTRPGAFPTQVPLPAQAPWSLSGLKTSGVALGQMDSADVGLAPVAVLAAAAGEKSQGWSLLMIGSRCHRLGDGGAADLRAKKIHGLSSTVQTVSPPAALVAVAVVVSPPVKTGDCGCCCPCPRHAVSHGAHSRLCGDGGVPGMANDRVWFPFCFDVFFFSRELSYWVLLFVTKNEC